MIKTLADVVKIVESSGNTFAIRYEPALYATKPAWAISQLQNIKNINKCSDPTALMISCTSFGAWQLLGVNIYSMGYKLPIAQYLQDETAQLSSALELMKSMGFDGNADFSSFTFPELLHFAQKWNGPGNFSNYAYALLHAGNNT